MFVPSGSGEEMFCVLYRPVRPPRRGIVICYSALAEQLRLYRLEVLAARAFAAQGHAVIRFHYRGAGHSGGLTEAMTLDTMIEDAERAACLLGAETGVAAIGWCGARWGALVAGLAALRHPEDPVALWAPVTDADQYLAEALQARRLRATLRRMDARTTIAEAREEMRRSGYLDVLGFPMHRGLYESATGRSLLELAVGPPRSVLLMQVSRGRELTAALARLRDRLVAGGLQVDAGVAGSEKATWWILGRSPVSADALIRRTAEWLGRLAVPP